MSQISAASEVRRYPRRILVVAVAVAIAGVLSAGAYAGYKLTQPATPVATLGCYETDSLDAATAVITHGLDSPVATCARTYASAFPGSQRPARFAACVLPSGSVGVFPASSADTCKGLGLATAPAAKRPSN